MNLEKWASTLSNISLMSWSSAPFSSSSLSLRSISSVSGQRKGLSQSAGTQLLCLTSFFSTFWAVWGCLKVLAILSMSSCICLSLEAPSLLAICLQQYIQMGFQELKYMLTAFRTKKAYLIFQVCQLLLSVTIIVVALTSKAHFKTPTVLILELVLFLTLAFDLLVVRWISEGGLCHRRINIFDLGLLCLFAATLCFLAVYAESPNEEKDYRELVETDDIIILVIVIARYIAQAVSLILTIRNSSANRQIHKEIKNVNLNNIELNLSANFGEAYKAEERVREKMTAKKNTLVEQL